MTKLPPDSTWKRFYRRLGEPTLIELLVVVVIIGIILAVIAGRITQ